MEWRPLMLTGLWVWASLNLMLAGARSMKMPSWSKEPAPQVYVQKTVSISQSSSSVSSSSSMNVTPKGNKLNELRSVFHDTLQSQSEQKNLQPHKITPTPLNPPKHQQWNPKLQFQQRKPRNLRLQNHQYFLRSIYPSKHKNPKSDPTQQTESQHKSSKNPFIRLIQTGYLKSPTRQKANPNSHSSQSPKLSQGQHNTKLHPRQQHHKLHPNQQKLRSQQSQRIRLTQHRGHQRHSKTPSFQRIRTRLRSRHRERLNQSLDLQKHSSSNTSHQKHPNSRPNHHKEHPNSSHQEGLKSSQRHQDTQRQNQQIQPIPSQRTHNKSPPITKIRPILLPQETSLKSGPEGRQLLKTMQLLRKRHRLELNQQKDQEEGSNKQPSSHGKGLLSHNHTQPMQSTTLTSQLSKFTQINTQRPILQSKILKTQTVKHSELTPTIRLQQHGHSDKESFITLQMSKLPQTRTHKPIPEPVTLKPQEVKYSLQTSTIQLQHEYNKSTPSQTHTHKPIQEPVTLTPLKIKPSQQTSTHKSKHRYNKQLSIITHAPQISKPPQTHTHRPIPEPVILKPQKVKHSLQTSTLRLQHGHNNKQLKQPSTTSAPQITKPLQTNTHRPLIKLKKLRAQIFKQSEKISTLKPLQPPQNQAFKQPSVAHALNIKNTPQTHTHKPFLQPSTLKTQLAKPEQTTTVLSKPPSLLRTLESYTSKPSLKFNNSSSSLRPRILKSSQRPHTLIFNKSKVSTQSKTITPGILKPLRVHTLPRPTLKIHKSKPPQSLKPNIASLPIYTSKPLTFNSSAHMIRDLPQYKSISTHTFKPLLLSHILQPYTPMLSSERHTVTPPMAYFEPLSHLLGAAFPLPTSLLNNPAVPPPSCSNGRVKKRGQKCKENIVTNTNGKTMEKDNNETRRRFQMKFSTQEEFQKDKNNMTAVEYEKYKQKTKYSERTGRRHFEKRISAQEENQKWKDHTKVIKNNKSEEVKDSQRSIGQEKIQVKKHENIPFDTYAPTLTTTTSAPTSFSKTLLQTAQFPMQFSPRAQQQSSQLPSTKGLIPSNPIASPLHVNPFTVSDRISKLYPKSLSSLDQDQKPVVKKTDDNNFSESTLYENKVKFDLNNKTVNKFATRPEMGNTNFNLRSHQKRMPPSSIASINQNQLKSPLRSLKILGHSLDTYNKSALQSVLLKELQLQHNAPKLNNHGGSLFNVQVLPGEIIHHDLIRNHTLHAKSTGDTLVFTENLNSNTPHPEAIVVTSKRMTTQNHPDQIPIFLSPKILWINDDSDGNFTTQQEIKSTPLQRQNHTKPTPPSKRVIRRKAMRWTPHMLPSSSKHLIYERYKRPYDIHSPPYDHYKTSAHISPSVPFPSTPQPPLSPTLDCNSHKYNSYHQHPRNTPYDMRFPHHRVLKPKPALSLQPYFREDYHRHPYHQLHPIRPKTLTPLSSPPPPLLSSSPSLSSPPPPPPSSPPRQRTHLSISSPPPFQQRTHDLLSSSLSPSKRTHTGLPLIPLHRAKSKVPKLLLPLHSKYSRLITKPLLTSLAKPPISFTKRQHQRPSTQKPYQLPPRSLPTSSKLMKGTIKTMRGETKYSAQTRNVDESQRPRTMIREQSFQDYSVHPPIPRTNFTCKRPGIFSDIESGCQVWHVCEANNRHHSFVCPNGTLFSELLLTCDWKHNVHCEPTSHPYGQVLSDVEYNKPYQQVHKINSYKMPRTHPYEVSKLKAEPRSINIPSMNRLFNPSHNSERTLTKVPVYKHFSITPKQSQANGEVYPELQSPIKYSHDRFLKSTPISQPPLSLSSVHFREFVPYYGDTYPMFHLKRKRI